MTMITNRFDSVDGVSFNENQSVVYRRIIAVLLWLLYRC